MVDKKRVIDLGFMNFDRRLKRNLFLLLINLLIAIFILTTFLLPTISASFALGNPNSSINGIYGASENITGWINMSFSSEPGNSTFNDTRGNSISLLEILKRNLGYSYTCNPLDCGGDYITSGADTEKTVTLAPGESKIYGIRLTGNISGINSLKFNLQSSALSSYTNQIEVDFLDDSTKDVINTGALDSATNPKDYGCFNLSNPTEEFIIGGTPYCERINLSNSPGFSIGAWVKNVSGLRNLSAAIYKATGEEVANCKLPSASSAGQEISCNVSYSVIEPEEHYVCIYSTSGSGVRRIRGYSDQQGCGFSSDSIPPDVTPSAYNIFAQGKNFSAVGTLNINKTMIDGRGLEELAYDYLIAKNPTLTCTSGCVIPVKITSNVDQDIILNNIEVVYDRENAGVVIDDKFYDVVKTFTKVTAGFQKLYLDYAGFSVPATIGNYTFSLKLNSRNIISKKVEVKNVPVINFVAPSKTAAAVPTEFTANVYSNYSLTRFFWDFGDNTAEVITQGNKVSHVYSSIGTYNLRVKATDQRNLNGSRTFVINVSSPKDMINESLFSMQRDLSKLKSQMASFSLFDQKILNSSLDLVYLQERINSLKIQYENASSEQEYNDIVPELLGLRIPESISKSGSAEGITLLSKTDNVNPDIIQEIAGGNYSSEKRESYIDAVTLWNLENLETKFDFTEFSGRYEEGTQPIIRVFEISSSEKRDISYDYYLIMPEPEGFQTDAQFERASGYVYINLKNEGAFSFSTTEDIDFTNLEAFASPAISRLSVTEEETLPEEISNKKWVIFSLVILFLLIIATIFYIIMQTWYKKKYEHYLFKNRNDLYNMVNYINRAIAKGMKKQEIEKNLKGAGWSSEKITYVMKKHFGKRM